MMKARIGRNLGSSFFGILFVLAASVGAGRSPEREPPAQDREGRQVKKVHVIAERFNFTPSRIKVREGTLLEIELSSDDTFHGFRIPSAEIDRVIPARGRGSVSVTFDAARQGSYAFECSRPCGAGHTMMRGVIVVE